MPQHEAMGLHRQLLTTALIRLWESKRSTASLIPVRWNKRGRLDCTHALCSMCIRLCVRSSLNGPSSSGEWPQRSTMKADYYDPYLHFLLQRPLLVVVIITAVEEEVRESSINSDKVHKLGNEWLSQTNTGLSLMWPLSLSHYGIKRKVNYINIHSFGDLNADKNDAWLEVDSHPSLR